MGDDRPNVAEMDLSNPKGIRHAMVWAGLGPNATVPYEDPDRGWVDPLLDQEARTAVRRFIAALWRACERAEKGQPLVLTSTDVTFCITHGATDHEGKKWNDCRFRQLLFFDSPMDEHALLWSDEIGSVKGWAVDADG